MHINSYHVCEALDWIPLVSTIAQGVHTIAQARFKNGLESAYGDYLKKYTFTQRCLIACPIINMVIKIIEGLKVLIKDPENIHPSILPYRKKNDPAFMLRVIKSTPYIGYYYASHTLRKNKEFALATANINITRNTWIYNLLPGALKQDRDIALAAVTQDYLIYFHIPSALQENREFALAAVTKEADLFWCIPDRLQKDPAILEAFNKQPHNKTSLS